MEKNVLRAIDGIALYPLISFGIFGLFFLGLLAYVLVVKPEVVGQMKNLPFADADSDADADAAAAALAVASTRTFDPKKGGLPC